MPQAELTLNVGLKNHEFTFKTTWGLFSPKEIDEGTRLLIENIEVKPTDNIFDLGCGYGPIGIVLGSIAKKGSVLMVDKDFVAVEYTQKNIEINGLKNAKVMLSNAFSHVDKDQQFDLIISNLPAKPGKEFFEIMMQDAYSHLKPSGRICVVTITGSREYIKRTFRELFGNYTKIAEKKGYTVAEAVK